MHDLLSEFEYAWKDAKKLSFTLPGRVKAKVSISVLCCGEAARQRNPFFSSYGPLAAQPVDAEADVARAPVPKPKAPQSCGARCGRRRGNMDIRFSGVTDGKFVLRNG